VRGPSLRSSTILNRFGSARALKNVVFIFTSRFIRITKEKESDQPYLRAAALKQTTFQINLPFKFLLLIK
jgi:hypothetical protein